MRPRLAMALMGLCGALILAGCGSGSSSSTSSEALSKSQFLAQGNAICAKGGKQIEEAGKKLFAQTKAPSQSAQEQFVTDTIVPSIQGQIDGIEALPAPSGDEDQVKAITDSAQSALDKVKSDPSLITDQAKTDPFTQANKLADAYGLNNCGSGNG